MAAPGQAVDLVKTAVTGPGVEVVPLPDFRGAAGYLRTTPALRRALAAALAPGGPIFGTGSDDVRYDVYAPGLLGGAVVSALTERGLRYGLELIGDPAEVATHLLGPWAGPVAGRLFARRCAQAAAVRYVTRETLQRRYPAAPGALVAQFPE
nr:hypothetical protein [Micromonospora sp. DSM 115978]